MARLIACVLAATSVAALVLLGVLNGIAVSRGEESFGVVGFAFLALAVLAPVSVGLFLVLEPDCFGYTAIGGSMLRFHGMEVIGGTGRYQGTTGKVISNQEVEGGSDFVVRVKLAR
jgi:hypothetical protein